MVLNQSVVHITVLTIYVQMFHRCPYISRGLKTLAYLSLQTEIRIIGCKRIPKQNGLSLCSEGRERFLGDVDRRACGADVQLAVIVLRADGIWIHKHTVHENTTQKNVQISQYKCNFIDFIMFRAFFFRLYGLHLNLLVILCITSKIHF